MKRHRIIRHNARTLYLAYKKFEIFCFKTSAGRKVYKNLQLLGGQFYVDPSVVSTLRHKAAASAS